MKAIVITGREMLVVSPGETYSMPDEIADQFILRGKATLSEPDKKLPEPVKKEPDPETTVTGAGSDKKTKKADKSA
jgi:hypothetical protein